MTYVEQLKERPRWFCRAKRTQLQFAMNDALHWILDEERTRVRSCITWLYTDCEVCTVWTLHKKVWVWRQWTGKNGRSWSLDVEVAGKT